METELLGHTGPDNAYLVEDYPYGFRARCRIRYWIEEDKKKGFRFVSQTEDPKRLRWNTPKKSTYADRGAMMFKDDAGHVDWYGLTSYASGTDVLAFLNRFPHADVSHLKGFALAKAKFLEKYASGQAFFTINGVRQEEKPADKARTEKDLADWTQVNDILAHRT